MEAMVVIGRETIVMVDLMEGSSGHTRETCYKLHGYPKRKGITSNSYANNATGSNQGNEVRAFDNHSSSTNTTPTGTHGGVSLFTPEQYSQILQMLNKGKDIVSTTANVATTSTAGMITAFMSDVVNRNWIIDTGASNHMVHNASLMTQYRNLDDKSNMHVNLPTGSQTSISHIGESLVLTDKTTHNSTTEVPNIDKSKVEKELLVILVYVDDLLVTGSSLHHIQQVRKDLQHRFKMKDLGELKYFLGIEFSRTNDGILMNQRKYALGLVSELGLTGCKPASTPLETNHKLTSIEFDECSGKVSNTEDTVLDDFGKYQRLIRRLLYLTMTRPDIAFVVQVLSQFMHSPKTSHMEAAIRVVKYIKGTAGLGLFMPSSKSSELTAYCDSDWAACVESRRSVTGYVVKFGNAAISWKAKKQNTVSRSSAEAEFRSMATTVAEITSQDISAKTSQKFDHKKFMDYSA
uniref:Reverse transcriptase Ty1/copia-type domain-containing protein n=1 Tax=Solanum lycopersicum TaxID=4081 RepID=A0A3Q7IS00_SOLLC